MNISVVIPTHNRSDALRLTLAGLSRQQTEVSWEVIVVNNSCTDDTDDVVQAQDFPVPLQLIHRDDTSGPGAARNAGARVAQGEFILFMDNDILTEPDFVQRHWEALTSNPGCWIVGQIRSLPEQELTPFGRFRVSLAPYVSPDQPARPAKGVTGQSLSLPRADFNGLGGFDEGYYTASVEDIELGVRAWQRGIKILYVPNIIAIHNDWAGFTIRDYCHRQRTYMHCEPSFSQKYGKDYPKPELLKQNSPLDWKHDSKRLISQKLLKQFAGQPVVQSALFGVSYVLERFIPWQPLLWKTYRVALAGSMYKGFQEGIALDQKRSRVTRSHPAERPFPS